MLISIKQKIKDFLIQTQKYTKTDMNYLTKAGFWSGLDYILTSVLSLVLAVAFANLLPKETYGIYRYILSLVGTIGILTLAGVDPVVTRAVARGADGAFNYGVRLQLKWNILFLTAILGLGGYYLIKGNEIFSMSILIAGVYFYLKSALDTYNAFWLGKKDFKRIALYSLLSVAVHVLSIIIILLLTKNVIAIITTYSLSTLLITIIFYFKTKKIIKIGSIDEKVKKEISNYSKHVSVMSGIASLAAYIDKIVLFQFLGPIQLAVYSFAVAIPDRIKGLSKILADITIPKLASKDLKDINKSFMVRLKQGVLFGLLLATIYILAAPFIFKYFFPQYSESIFYSQLLALTFILTIGGSYGSGANQAQRLIKVQYISTTAVSLFAISSIVIFGALWGIMGVISARLITSMFGFLFGLRVWKKEVKKIIESQK